MSAIEVRIRGSFNSSGGYGKVNRNLAKGLTELGVTVATDPIKKEERIGLPTANVSKNAIAIDSMVPTIGLESYGKYRIIYTTVEAQTLPQNFLSALEQYNEIWVTSNFCRSIIKNYGVQKPIFVIPDSVDVALYDNNGPKHQFSQPLKPFVFISVFGWSYRKGYDVLLKAYLNEFTASDPVTLLLVTRHPNGNKAVQQLVKKYIERFGRSKAAHIVRCSKNIDEKNMPAYYRACDAFCLFSRGEGFLLPAVEASLCGLPIITTKFSGPTMYLNDDNSFLLEPDGYMNMPPGLTNSQYWDDQQFPSLTSDACLATAGGLMRAVFKAPEDAKAKNRRLMEFVRVNFSIGAISQGVKQRLEEIWQAN